MSASYLSKLETGKIKEPSGPVLVRLAKVFEWSTTELDRWFTSDTEVEVDRCIEELEASFNSGPLMLTLKPLREDLKGKRLYLTLLKEYKSRTPTRRSKKGEH